jgi:hypothetical protein
MPSPPDNHPAHDYAERIRKRLPRRHQELREGTGLSMYALWLKCGVSRDTISRVEEVREYRMRFWDKGTPNGDWTDVVKVTVSP